MPDASMLLVIFLPICEIIEIPDFGKELIW